VTNLILDSKEFIDTDPTKVTLDQKVIMIEKLEKVAE